MNPPPIAVALMLCKYVHFEGANRRNVSLIGCFNRLEVESFPASPSFYVYAALTGALGDTTIKIVIERLDSGDDIYAREVRVRIPDKLATGQLALPITKCIFPVDGWYQVTLYTDDQWLISRRVNVTKP